MAGGPAVSRNAPAWPRVTSLITSIMQKQRWTVTAGAIGHRDTRTPLLGLLLAAGLALRCSGDGDGAPAAKAGASGAEAGSGGARAECMTEPVETYRRRIEPLLVDANPKSCNQCHLSGVDLSIFARETPCETMACLVEEGLVDLDAPEQSKILGWIERASPDSELITDEVIQAEYDGFREWIEASAECRQACAGVGCDAPAGRESCASEPPPTAASDEIPAMQDCSDVAIEQRFADEVYAWRGRCSPCHHSNQPNADAAAPRWIRTEGNCATASLATLRRVTSSGYIDVENPEQSLLLLKPLAVSAGGVVHGGHDKFADTNDPGYRSFLEFARAYAECNPAP